MVDILNEEDFPELNEDQPVNFDAILNAPNYADFVKVRQSRTSKEYEGRTNSVLKALLGASLQAGDLPDAAAIIHYGPAFSRATGNLADSSDYARRAIDLITSPSSPVAMFAIAAIPLAAQIMRNHEAQVQDIPATWRERRALRKVRKETGAPKPPPRFTLRVLGREIPIRLRLRLGPLVGAFRAQTHEPASLTSRVFTDRDVITALERQGIRLVQEHGESA